MYKDPARQALMAGLRYATDQGPGLMRKAARTGKFAYYDAQGQKIADAKTLDRINGFVIPPVWTDVWISPSATIHLQVTGHDALGRKQYRSTRPGTRRAASPDFCACARLAKSSSRCAGSCGRTWSGRCSTTTRWWRW